MNKENITAFNSVVSDNDSHESTTIIFFGENGRKSNVVLVQDNIYSIIYPHPIAYSETSLIVKAKGTFKILDSKPWLYGASVWYSNQPPKSDGLFYITLVEGTKLVNETKKKTTIAHVSTQQKADVS